ncbi:hypothetical protein Ccrd_000144 [Cynara cardunculus var. scolymus]|uniref:Uncharacterized protein n=1 Tax=Cynara cardunculus var. scolymus TaxID=59895 RepID=A0A103XVP3_CYNCS|nr:hypothetical protein Ccrd_000144 [Cynara cardunculus var. scolymus]
MIEKPVTLAVTTLHAMLASLEAYPFGSVALLDLPFETCRARNELFPLVEKVSISNKSELASLAASLPSALFEIPMLDELRSSWKLFIHGTLEVLFGPKNPDFSIFHLLFRVDLQRLNEVNVTKLKNNPLTRLQIEDLDTIKSNSHFIVPAVPKITLVRVAESSTSTSNSWRQSFLLPFGSSTPSSQSFEIPFPYGTCRKNTSISTIDGSPVPR